MRSGVKKNYSTLDGLRGVAALSVLVDHLISFFYPNNWNLFHGYLAVDFFFVLSGFVIAHAYEGKLADGSLTLSSFAILRLKRLLPLAWLGVALGAIPWLLSPFGNGGIVGFLGRLPWALVLLPQPLTAGLVIPMNISLWSLSVEFWSNLIFAALIHRANTRTLCVTAVLGFIGAAYATICCGGYMYGHTSQTFFFGFARMAFAFPVGIMIYRHRQAIAGHAGIARVARSLSPWSLSLLLLIAFSSIALVPQGLTQSIVELMIVTLVLPCVVLFGAVVSAPSASLKPMSALGALSYPLYATHIPIILLASEISASLLSLVVAGICAIVVALLAQTYYEPAVRKLLSRRESSPLPARSKMPVA